VLRVAAGYAVIAWLLLQIADVIFEPLGVPRWAMTSLIVAAVFGFPIAIALAWFYEIGDQGVQLDTAAEGVVRPSVRGRRRYADVAIIGVLLVVVAVLLVRQADIGRPPPPASPAIAVLPFENVGGDPGQEYFSDGLAIEVLDRLGRVPGLRVIASSSSFSFKGQGKDVKFIASQLGVTTVLEGSVRRDGRKLKVNAKLIDGGTGYQVWSGSFDREVTDIFAVQAELAAAVIEAIVPAARGDVVAGPPPTTNLDAHDHYLLGLAAQRSRSASRLAESVQHLEQAVALDPSYAQAHAALANSRLLHTGYAGGPAPDATKAAAQVARAEQSVYKALALDASLSDAHGALGNVLRFTERPGAEDEYKRALELNPNNAIVAHDYAVLLSADPARKADSDALTDLSLALDPRSAIAWANKLDRVRQNKGLAAYRKQLAVAMTVFAGDTDGLGAVALAVADGHGYPQDAYKLAHAISSAGGSATTARLKSLQPLVALGAYDECLARIDAIKATGEVGPLSFAPEEITATGLKGDFARLEKVLAITERFDVPDRYQFFVEAFWHAAQGRFENAAAALSKAGGFEQNEPGFLGTALEKGALPAVVRIYRAAGKEVEAQALLARFQEKLRKQSGPNGPDGDDEMLLAEVAMATGQRAEAVRHLQAAMQKVPVPTRLHPQLPWYRELEGEPGYAQVIQELRRRQAEFLAEIAQLDASPTR
jgi:TolB-like protein